MYCLVKYSAKACASFGKNGKSFSEMEDLLKSLKQEITENMTILIKGSRTMKMERAVDALSAKYGETA
jgi:UDP-N-acetylmuramoyl-tripeptide--D-alanyl-D-alanine ligase